MPAALVVLAVAAFAIGTAEFVIIGLVPEIARSLAVSVPTAGVLVTGYALAVTIGATMVTALTGSVPRRRLAASIMALFALGNLISALAPDFGVLLAGRVVTGVAHGVFFAIGAPVAMSLVERSRGARAVALMFAGLTVAMVLGVPLGTFIGQRLDWRAPLLVVAALGGFAALLLGAFLPRDIAHTPPATVLSQFTVLGKPGLLVFYLVAALGFGGSFAVLTFLSPMMTTVTHVTEATVNIALIAFGGAAVVGNLVGGGLSDALGPRRGLAMALTGLLLALAALPFSAPHWGAMFANLFVWSACCFCVGPIVQAGVVAVAQEVAPDAVAASSGFNIAAFNFGISAFSAIGGLLVAGPGVMATPWGAAVAAGGALALTPFVRANRLWPETEADEMRDLPTNAEIQGNSIR